MKTIVAVVIFLTVGCSNQAFYNERQIANRNECYQLPVSQREDCLEKTNKTFDAYERERKELSGE